MRAYAHYNPFNVREPAELPDWQKVFPNSNPLDLEIGFANGVWLIDYARIFPKRNIVGLETRSKFINNVRDKIATEKLDNAYVLKANVNTALEKLFKDVKLSNVYIMFPDPWYKKGHLNRRVVQPDFIKLLAKHMLRNGRLQIATDRKFLAEDMLRVLEESDMFENVYGKNNYAPQNVDGLETSIEIYQKKLGNPIYRLVFICSF